MSASLAIAAQLQALGAEIASLQCRTSVLEGQRPTSGLLATFGFVADAGGRDSEQAAVAALMAEWQANEYWFGGDNIYTSPVTQAGLATAWSNFAFAKDKARVAPGNHDIDGDPLLAQTLQFMGAERMPHRYYSVDYPSADLALFVINTGLDSARALREPDGNTVGSAQYWWLVNELKACKRGRRIVMGHHPFVTSSAESYASFPDIDWKFETLGVNAVLFGHTHCLEHIQRPGLDILNCSSVRPDRDSLNATTLQGSVAGAQLVWNDRHGTGNVSDAGATKISVYGDCIWFDVYRAFDKKLLHSFTIR